MNFEHLKYCGQIVLFGEMLKSLPSPPPPPPEPPPLNRKKIIKNPVLSILNLLMKRKSLVIYREKKATFLLHLALPLQML